MSSEPEPEPEPGLHHPCVVSCGVIRYDVYYNSFQLARSRLVTALVSVSIVTGGGGDDDGWEW